jgi:hypothetical protein
MPVATQTGAITDEGDFDAADAFLERMKTTAPEPVEDDEDDNTQTDEDSSDDQSEADGSPDEGDEEADEESEETTEDDGEQDEESNDADEGEDKPKAKDADDKLVVKIKVDGKEHEVSVKDLKRLYGQETALNRKSQEVAAERKKVEETGAKQVVALTKMLERAQERAKPYQSIDFFALAKDPNISAEEMTALRKEAQSAFDDVNFFGQELDQTFKQLQDNRAQNLRTQALAAHKVLSDPKSGIDGWNEPLYNDIRSYAVSQGLPAGYVNEIADPNAIKLLHKAMMYDRGKKALSKTTKIDKTPKKIIKTSSNSVSSNQKGRSGKDAMDKLRMSGDVDDAASVFLSRMSS